MKIKDIVLISLFCAIIAVFGLIPGIYVPGIPVPIILQNMGVILAGSILGFKRGFFTVVLFNGLVLAGFPILAGGRGGLSVFYGPSVGFLIGYPFVAFLVGFLNEKIFQVFSTLRTEIKIFFYLFVSNVTAGICFLYLIGVPTMAFMTKMELSKAFLYSLTWLPGDLIKCLLAAWITIRVQKYYKI